MEFLALNAEINIVSFSYNFQIILFLLSYMKSNNYIIMWSCPGNMPKYYPGLRDILPDRSLVQVICQHITQVPG